MIVINLRETWTVGPIIGLLDTGIDTVGRLYADSILQGVTEEIAERFYRAPIRYGSLAVLIDLFVTGVLGSLLGKISGKSRSIVRIGAVLAVDGLFVESSWPDIRKSKPIRLLAAVLEPPDSPNLQTSRENVNAAWVQ